MNKKYCLYARVSPKGSGWDCEETSIGVQLAEMRAHCLRIDPGATFVEVFDEFKSGKNLNRAGVQKILCDLDRRPVGWDCLVVWNLDRLSRSLCDALPIFTKLRDAGCEFISINQEYLSYTGAMARYMLQQTIAIAELERGMTSERVSAKMRWIASAGKVPWGRIPIGYVRDPKLKNTVIIDEPRAEIVRTIFRLYVSGKLTFAAINERWSGVFKTRNSLYLILRNPLYVGELHYAGKVYQSEHPAIIDRETFDQAQKLLASKKRQCFQRKGGVSAREYLLSGLVRCHCGHYMTGYSVTGHAGRKFFYYKCTNPLCKNAINADALESAVLQKIAGIFADETEIRASLAEFLQAEKLKNDSIRAQLSSLEKDLHTAKEKENRIKEIFLSGVVNKENSAYWNAELLSVRGEIADLEKQIEKVETPAELNFDDLLPDLMQAAKEWSIRCSSGTADFPTKRNLILSTVSSLECVYREKNKMQFKLKLIMTGSKEWWALKDFVIISFFEMFCGFRSVSRAEIVA
jgi:DNA invertase Pin-like site-specific DNA recombinase